MITTRFYSIQSKLSLVFLMAIVTIISGGCLSLYFSNHLLSATQLFLETTLPRIETANALQQTALEVGNYTKELSRGNRIEYIRKTSLHLTALLDRLVSLTATISQEESDVDILALNLSSQAIRSQAQFVFQMEAQLAAAHEKELRERNRLWFELLGLPTLDSDVDKHPMPATEKHDRINKFIMELLAHLYKLEGSETLEDVDVLEGIYEQSRARFAEVEQVLRNYGDEDGSIQAMEQILLNFDHLFVMQRQYYQLKNDIGSFVDELGELVDQLTQLASEHVSTVFNHFHQSANQVIKRERQSLYLTIFLMVCSIFVLYILHRRIVIHGFGDRLSLISRAMGVEPGSGEGGDLPLHGRDEIADMARAAEELLDKAKKLKNLATIDELTQVYNRRRFFELAENEVQRVTRRRTLTSVLMLDLDHFKLINDTHGHSFGDRVLYETAQACNQSIRTIDVFARYGGEEFALLMPETSLEEGLVVAERIRQTIEDLQLVTDSGVEVNMTMSIGLAESNLSEMTVEQALDKADTAMYQAKKQGRNRVAIFHATQSDDHHIEH